MPQTYIEDLTVVTDIAGVDGVVKVAIKLNAPGGGAGVLQLKGDGTAHHAAPAFVDGLSEATLLVPNAHFWSDKDPYLCDLTVATQTDSYCLNVGIRTIKVEGPHILLNGKPVKLKGYGRHEDFPASGKGFNPPLFRCGHGWPPVELSFEEPYHIR